MQGIIYTKFCKPRLILDFDYVMIETSLITHFPCLTGSLRLEIGQKKSVNITKTV